MDNSDDDEQMMENIKKFNDEISQIYASDCEEEEKQNAQLKRDIGRQLILTTLSIYVNTVFIDLLKIDFENPSYEGSKYLLISRYVMELKQSKEDVINSYQSMIWYGVVLYIIIGRIGAEMIYDALIDNVIEEEKYVMEIDIFYANVLSKIFVFGDDEIEYYKTKLTFPKRKIKNKKF